MSGAKRSPPENRWANLHEYRKIIINNNTYKSVYILYLYAAYEIIIT